MLVLRWAINFFSFPSSSSSPYLLPSFRLKFKFNFEKLKALCNWLCYLFATWTHFSTKLSPSRSEHYRIQPLLVTNIFVVVHHSVTWCLSNTKCYLKLTYFYRNSFKKFRVLNSAITASNLSASFQCKRVEIVDARSKSTIDFNFDTSFLEQNHQIPQRPILTSRTSDHKLNIVQFKW